MRNLVLAGALVVTLGGCASTGPDIHSGMIYSSFKGPNQVGAPVATTKQGEACASNILGIVALGDNSITEAKKRGGVTKIALVDYHRMNILGFYGEVCTVVRGE